MSLLQILRAVGVFVVGLATVVAAIFAAGVSAEELGDALWPDGTVALLAVVVLFLLLGWVLDRRGAGGGAAGVSAASAAELGTPVLDAGDQQRLDELLHLLCRRSIQVIEYNDFAEAWPETLNHPVSILLHEFGGAEHHFNDPELEARRVDLFEKAEVFSHREAMHGWPSFVNRKRTGYRIPGYYPGEAEGDTEKERTVMRHHEAIYGPSRDFLDAHTALIRTARERGYNVDAVSRDRHPRVVELDESLGLDRLREEEEAGES